jgi:hypothetical protein
MKKKRMRTGKSWKCTKYCRNSSGRLSCDSDVPQVGSARSDWTGVVKVNCCKINVAKRELTLCVCVYI